jgi:hypothetical protein
MPPTAKKNSIFKEKLTVNSCVAAKKVAFPLLKEDGLISWLSDYQIPDFLAARVQALLKAHLESSRILVAQAQKRTFSRFFLLLLGPHKGTLTIETFPGSKECVDYANNCLSYDTLKHLASLDEGTVNAHLASAVAEYESELKDLPAFLRGKVDLGALWQSLKEIVNEKMDHYTLTEYELV